MYDDPFCDFMDEYERVNPEHRALTREETRADYKFRLALARMRVYNRASHGNPATIAAGIIGVGLISYAKYRLATFDRRVAALT